MGPPIVTGDELTPESAENRACKVDIVSDVRLTPTERQAMANWRAKVAKEKRPRQHFQQYVVHPAVKWETAENGRRLFRRFSCAGFVLDCYGSAGIARPALTIILTWSAVVMSFLGGVRASSQMISYEVAMGLYYVDELTVDLFGSLDAAIRHPQHNDFTALHRRAPALRAVLFNGGSIRPPLLRQRLREQIGVWQDGFVPLVLENGEPDLAVARGAARFGALLHQHSGQIAAGAAILAGIAIIREAYARTRTHACRNVQFHDVRSQQPALSIALGAIGNHVTCAGTIATR